MKSLATRRPLSRHLKLAVLLMFALASLVPDAAAYAAYNKPMYGFAMYGEPKLPANFKHFPYVNPNAPKGGVLHLAALDSYSSFNPFTPRGTPARGLASLVQHDTVPSVPVRIYDSLGINSLDEPFTMYGLIAKTIEVPPDRSWVKFVLRPEARFHDGSPITVDDVIFTFKVLRDKGQPFYRYYYKNIKSVEKTAPHTVLFKFASSGQKELPLIICQMPILSKAYWENRDITAPIVTPPLSSGPYKITKYQIGRSVTYSRVKDYWGKDLPVNVGRFNFDTVRVDYYGDPVAAFEAFKAGHVDFWFENKAQRWAAQYDFPAFKRGDVLREKFPIKSTQPMQGFYFNTRRPKFHNRLVREALTYGFDFPWANRVLAYGAYTHARSYFNNSELESHGVPTGEELKLLEPFRGKEPPEVFTKEYNPPTTSADHTEYDNLRIAQQLLAKAGYTAGKGGKLVDKQGKPFSFEILLFSPGMQRIAETYADNLRKLGIQVNIRLVDTTQYVERVRKFDYDMIVTSLGGGDSPGNEQRDEWGSAAADQPGSSNYAGVRDPAVDAIIEGLVKADTRADLVAHVHALDRLLQWGYYCVPMWYLPAVRLAWWKRLQHPDVVPRDGPSLSTWWLKPGSGGGKQ